MLWTLAGAGSPRAFNMGYFPLVTLASYVVSAKAVRANTFPTIQLGFHLPKAHGWTRTSDPGVAVPRLSQLDYVCKKLRTAKG